MSEFPIADFVAQRPFLPMANSHVEYTLNAGGQTINLLSGAKYVLVQAIDQNVRLTFDGTNPTAASGFRIVADDPPFIIALSSVLTLKANGEAAGAILVLEYGE